MPYSSQYGPVSFACLCRFGNANYRNTWSTHARQSLRHTGDTSAWWANGWVLCSKVPQQVWGDQWVTSVRNMLMCSAPNMQDCDFFINKRDTACVRMDGADPMNPLDMYQPRTVSSRDLLPVFSFYTGEQYADIACPLGSDWAFITQSVYAQASCAEPTQRYPVTYWDIKQPKAVFRGSTTGVGLTRHTNQRVRLCTMNHPLVDAGAVSNNRRIRFCPIERRVGVAEPIPTTTRMSMQKQQEEYKYTICVDGHSAPDRLIHLLQGHQCILKVESPYHALSEFTWVQNFMHEWEHFIPVRRDLGDLDQRLRWAIQNDKRSQEICTNCRQLSEKYLTKESITQWWDMMSCFIGGDG